METKPHGRRAGKAAAAGEERQVVYGGDLILKFAR